MLGRSKFLSLLVALAFVVAACGSSGGDDADAADATGSGDDSAEVSGDVADPTVDGTGDGEDGAATSDPADSADTPAATAPTDSAAPSGGGTDPAPTGGGEPAPSTTATVAPASGSESPSGFAAAGNYTYDATEDGNKVVQTLTVQAPEGSLQTAKTFVDGEEVGTQTLDLRADGAYLTHLKQTQGGVSFEFKPDPPVLVAPAAPTQGQTWTWKMTSTDESLTVDAKSTIAGFEKMTVGGQSVDVVKIVTDSQISGAFTGTQKTTMWLSIERGLVLKEESQTDGNIGAVPVSFSSSRVIRSVTPA